MREGQAVGSEVVQEVFVCRVLANQQENCIERDKDSGWVEARVGVPQIKLQEKTLKPLCA